jgi:hypothetical protein
MNVMVKIIAKLMSRYGISKGANIAKNMGFKSKSIQEAGKNTIKKNIGKGGWKNRLTPEQSAIMRKEGLKEQRMIKQELEDIRKHGTPMQQDWDEYMRSLNEEFAYLKNRKGEF